MSRILQCSITSLLIALSSTFVGAQSSQEAPPVAVPSQITSAQRVFISNAGEETSYSLHRMNWYSGGPNRVYNEFYNAVKTWGRYELVSAPADADLVLEIGFKVEADRDTVGPDVKSRFRLLILDPKTHTTLWAFSRYLEPANRAKTRDRNYDQALRALVDDLKSFITALGSIEKK